MNPIEWLLLTILRLVIWIVIADVIISWLVAFDVVNRSNQVVRTVMDFTNRVTYPLLKPIRNVVPAMGGLDISPIILIIGLMFLQQVIFYFF